MRCVTPFMLDTKTDAQSVINWQRSVIGQTELKSSATSPDYGTNSLFQREVPLVLEIAEFSVTF